MWGRALLGWGDYGAAAVHSPRTCAFTNARGRGGPSPRRSKGGGVRWPSGRLARAVRWWGASAALREQIGAPMWACDRPTYERDVAEARAALGAAAFDAAWAAGQAAAWRNKAVAEALDADTDGGRP